MRINLKKSNLGFTLVEVIVALGIFSIATTYAVSIFVQSNQVQKRTANADRLLADARYVLEVMAREVRLGHLDYAYYASQGISLANMPLTQDGAILAIRDADNNQLLFRRVESAQDQGRYVVQTFAGGAWLDITPEDLNVELLSFYITPAVDSMVWSDVLVDYPSDIQPRVTIVLSTSSLHEDIATTKISHLQTTVTERKYAR
ncbi:MAG: type II secretion system protein [Patescibacteria group bacterium]|jgi:prepilin-type N-terminal cleavage/methylation domain-containing protein